MSLSAILSKITGKGVLTAGAVGAAASSDLLGLHSFVAVAGLMVGILALTYSVKLQGFIQKKLAGFADVPEWPRFVLLGVASLVAAHHGGRPAMLVLGCLLTAMDGNVFNALY